MKYIKKMNWLIFIIIELLISSLISHFSGISTQNTFLGLLTVNIVFITAVIFLWIKVYKLKKNKSSYYKIVKYISIFISIIVCWNIIIITILFFTGK